MVGKKDYSLTSGERQVAGRLEDIRSDHTARYRYGLDMMDALDMRGVTGLDVFCGNGYGAGMIADAGHGVFAIDGSRDAIDFARMHYAAPKCFFVERLWPFAFERESFDFVFALESIEHVDDGNAFFDALSGALRPGGLLIYSTPNQDLMPFDSKQFKFHTRHYRLSETLELASERGLSILKWGGQEVYHIPESGPHRLLADRDFAVNGGKAGQFTIVIARKDDAGSFRSPAYSPPSKPFHNAADFHWRRYMERTPILGLPFIAAAQAQKHVTHNEALRDLDALVQITVESRTAVAPPADTVDGQRWLVPEDHDPAGAFAGQPHALAVRQDGGWTFHTPRSGWLAYIRDEASLHVFDGATWDRSVSDGPTETSRRFDAIGVGMEPNEDHRLAVAASSSLFDHGEDGDTRLFLNKRDAQHAAGLIFQQRFSGRAELGLTGTNAFSINVSGDGHTFKPAMTASSDAKVRFPNGFADPKAVARDLGLYHEFLAVAADTAVLVDVGKDQFASILIFYTNNPTLGKGMAYCRAAQGPACRPIAVDGAVSFFTGALSGTTGSSGHLNVSCDDNGLYYFENRSAAPVNVYAYLLTHF